MTTGCNTQGRHARDRNIHRRNALANNTLRSNTGGRTNRAIALAVPLMSLLVFACTPELPKPDPRFVLGSPYKAGAVWYYPHESYDWNETGLASVLQGEHTPLTTDGEVYDQAALAGAHPTIQLPAIARVTNLENGLQVIIRLNDRGTPDPRRLIQVTSRTATLLEMSQTGMSQAGMSRMGATRVRLEVLPAESHAAAEALPGAPRIAVIPAARGAVEVAELSPPPGVRQGSGRVVQDVVPSALPPATAAVPPMRLPEVRTQASPAPGHLMVRLDTFDTFVYAAVQQAKMQSAGARIVNVRQRRTWQYRVEIGPLPDVARADAVLLQALGQGIPDARIVID